MSEPTGQKIEEGLHKDEVATFLLLNQSYASILRFLEEKGAKVSFQTLKAFEASYVSKLEPQVRDALIKKAIDEQAQRNQVVVQNVVSTTLSYVEVLRELCAEADRQLARLNNSPVVAAGGYNEEVGEWLDRKLEYRKELEKTLGTSETERVRKEAILDTAKIALEFISVDENTSAFYKRVDALLTRTTNV